MIIFPGTTLSGLLSRCRIGEDRDWEKAQMEGQHELNLICGHSAAAVSVNDSAQRRCACNRNLCNLTWQMRYILQDE